MEFIWDETKTARRNGSRTQTYTAHNDGNHKFNYDRFHLKIFFRLRIQFLHVKSSALPIKSYEWLWSNLHSEITLGVEYSQPQQQQQIHKKYETKPYECGQSWK